MRKLTKDPILDGFKKSNDSLFKMRELKFDYIFEHEIFRQQIQAKNSLNRFHELKLCLIEFMHLEGKIRNFNLNSF